MKLFQDSIYADGKTYPWHKELITCKQWSLSWYPHVSAVRYGWYQNTNPTFNSGLWMALNLPLIGDFSLWKHYVPAVQ